MKKRKSPFVVFLCCVLAVPTVGVLMGLLAEPEGGWLGEAGLSLLRPWLATGAILGAAHVLLRPILRLLSAPIGCLTLGLFGFVIDIGLIYGCAAFVNGFEVASLLYAALTAIVINTICAITSAR